MGMLILTLEDQAPLALLGLTSMTATDIFCYIFPLPSLNFSTLVFCPCRLSLNAPLWTLTDICERTVKIIRRKIKKDRSLPKRLAVETFVDRLIVCTCIFKSKHEREDKMSPNVVRIYLLHFRPSRLETRPNWI